MFPQEKCGIKARNPCSHDSGDHCKLLEDEHSDTARSNQPLGISLRLDSVKWFPKKTTTAAAAAAMTTTTTTTELSYIASRTDVTTKSAPSCSPSSTLSNEPSHVSNVIIT